MLMTSSMSTSIVFKERHTFKAIGYYVNALMLVYAFSENTDSIIIVIIVVMMIINRR